MRHLYKKRSSLSLTPLGFFMYVESMGEVKTKIFYQVDIFFALQQGQHMEFDWLKASKIKWHPQADLRLDF